MLLVHLVPPSNKLEIITIICFLRYKKAFNKSFDFLCKTLFEHFYFSSYITSILNQYISNYTSFDKKKNETNHVLHFQNYLNKRSINY